MSEADNKELKKKGGQDSSASQVFGEEPERGKNPRPSDEIYTGQEYQTSGGAAQEKKANIGKDISILVMITLVAGALLGVAYGVTKGPIASAQAQARAKAQSAVMSMAQDFRTLYGGEEEAGEIPAVVPEALEQAGIGSTKVTQIDAALDKDGNVIGYVITASDPDGYGGDVELMCGITSDADSRVTIEGISFLSLSETAGMGMRAKDPEFSGQFSGRTLEPDDEIIYTKGGASQENEIDAISGCTVTTSAVTDNVNAALIAANLIQETEQEAGE